MLRAERRRRTVRERWRAVCSIGAFGVWRRPRGGLRSGTLNVPGIVGFGKACEIAREEMGRESVRIGRLRDWFERIVQSGVDGVSRNGSFARRLPGNSSLRFDGVDAEALIANSP